MITGIAGTTDLFDIFVAGTHKNDFLVCIISLHRHLCRYACNTVVVYLLFSRSRSYSEVTEFLHYR